MKRIASLLLIGTALAATGCARVRGHQGYIVDQTLVSGIQPGIDNRGSVEKTLGRPTFGGQFDARDWYYVSRETKQLAFSQPKPVSQTVLHVRFDAAGNVVAIDKTGVEKIASISPIKDKTPTLGRHRSFFSEVFGNIGTVGSSTPGAASQDNPESGGGSN
ncbi:outer membrane protein assembly factor BamE [Sphingomonas paeninsulae]|jgi:outer membrane protein assembly factor BamE (lipoprotein component of BamABCDE complex)|uniref:Outer membrane protein assembly factor BamE n=1 Tax=Sphingomonas paeninsulae TaxID=2319844 RepID=A0A494TIA9_SPHPE|nr:outer membrane protein assembly factor BamE [Sphingomonas paeninsulae]AYJ86713.1 outer membrane protein assembly factor BamE [Sphingomonas paeninsulae]